MYLSECKIGYDYIIKDIYNVDVETRNFLFSLGCYSGQSITLIYKANKNFIVAIKDSRYSIDYPLANSIEVIC